MKIQILQDPRYLIDGLVDCVAVGLYKLGHQVNLPPHKSYLWGNNNLPPAFECFTANIENYQGIHYDLSIVGLPYSGLIRGNYIVLDSSDSPDLAFTPLKNCIAYFKREKRHLPLGTVPVSRNEVKSLIRRILVRLYQNKVYPISLSTLVTPAESISHKEWDVGYIGSNGHGRDPFIKIIQESDLKIFLRVSSYYMTQSKVMPMSIYVDMIRRCKAVLCPYGAGEDTYRLWETLALGAVPLMQKFSIEHSHPFRHGHNALLFSDADSLKGCLSMVKAPGLDQMATNALNLFKSTHTPEQRAQYVLDTIGK